jgi:phytoene dehydrogenase-like protein
MTRVAVVGAGHNGLVAACYLARAGLEVAVFEAQDTPGGGCRTEEVVPGYRFDLHAVAHNLINMTTIPEDLGLSAVGLEYLEMDPFAVGLFEDGRRVRFHRSVEQTLASIAEVSPRDVDPYRQFIAAGNMVMAAVLPSIRGERAAKTIPGLLGGALRLGSSGRQELVRDVAGGYGSLLRRRLSSNLTRGPLAAFAAHGSVGPTIPGGALFGFWQAAYHRFGQWHPRGGSQALVTSLTSRLIQLGGQVRCGAEVASIHTHANRVEFVELTSGERIAADLVVTAIDPRSALLKLLTPALEGRPATDLAATRSGNVVQGVIHLATTALPPYPNSRPGDWNGLQSLVDDLAGLERAWVRAEAEELPDPLPLYCFTTSALDPGLAPPGGHTVYLACPATPFRVRGGWNARREEFVERAISELESRAPGFRASIEGVAFRTPEEMSLGGLWPGAHPMQLDLSLDQLGAMRPTPQLGSHRSGIEGLYLCGAGTNPSGGILGTSGRLAARALLRDLRRR